MQYTLLLVMNGAGYAFATTSGAITEDPSGD